MSNVIWKLRQEHRRLTRLMDLIAREVRAFEQGHSPDYYLVESILEYILNYPELCHHPKEDLVLAKLRVRDPEAAANVGDLEHEHEKLAALTRRFAAAVRNVLQDEQLPREWFVGVASDYLTFQRQHLQMEEVVFFPPALRALTPEDWEEIEDDLATPYDPLFDEGKLEEKFARIHKEIIEWGEIFEEGADSLGPTKKPTLRAVTP